MRSTTLAFCAALLALSGSAAFAQDGQHGFLTPEQRFMMRGDQPHADWQSMTPEQRAAMRDQMRAKWESMSDADKQAMKAQLQAKWDALPADQKQTIEQKIAERHEHRQQSGDSQQ